MKIPFNIPYTFGNESIYVKHAISSTDTATGENYVKKCRKLIKEKWNFNEVFLTNSCTSALEVCALLLDIKQGDEIIVPSYTFPSTANAFIRQGATIVFADSGSDYPAINEKGLKSLITARTKAIVPVHYAGIACDMDRIMDLAENHGLYVIEDAAAAFDSSYKSRQLGSIGHLGCLSFHRTKNLQCGEGGAILINDDRFLKRVINILEKGTNRNELVSGKVGRYEWVEIGSSYQMTELHAAFLYAQLEKAEWIKTRRLFLWNLYSLSFKILEEKGLLKLPFIPDYASHNANTFYLVLNNKETMFDLMSFLKGREIQTTVHYTSLDQSVFWKRNHTPDRRNINSLKYNDSLLRLPLYNSMSEDETKSVIDAVLKYFNV
ncbi:MAG: dTDP-4-amino-4,6-dideoxygalactose transaminase [Bacteroidetes bacterium]|nr:MAG: dTDP-4-amino-4,6-dideoxygalactose transaminase [Bacteroidota bacterium]